MIKNFGVNQQKLKMAQQQLVRKLQNNKLSPTNVARGLRLQLLDRKQWDEVELAKLVPQMTVDQLQSYVEALPKGTYAKMLVHGNLSVRACCVNFASAFCLFHKNSPPKKEIALYAKVIVPWCTVKTSLVTCRCMHHL